MSVLSQELAAGGAPDASVLIDQLFLAMKTCSIHGAAHPSTRAVVESAQMAVRDTSPPFALQFVSGAVFRDRRLVALELETFTRARELAAALANLSVHELAFDEVPHADALLRLAGALARGAQGPSEALSLINLPPMRWRELPHARLGEDAEQVDGQVYTASQVVLALAEAEQIAARTDGPWPWATGVSIVRRLERAIEIDLQATARAVELAPGAWTPTRRTIAAAFAVSAVLSRVGVSDFVRRAATHAITAACVHGYRARAGTDVEPAAQAALRAMLRSPVRAGSGVDPHRLRVSTLVHALGGGRNAELLALLRLAYLMERKRSPAGVSFDLTGIDLLAYALNELQTEASAPWIRALIATLGAVPMGAYVLADGMLGVVMEPSESGDPWRPKVLVGGRMITPAAPVQLCSPLGRARAGAA